MSYYDLSDIEWRAGWWMMLWVKLFGTRIVVTGETSGDHVAYLWRGKHYIAELSE